RGPQTIDLGHDAAGRPVTIQEDHLAAHGLILGASGAGKSTTLMRIGAHQIQRGRPLIVIDLKGSPDLAAKLGAQANAANRRLRIWTPEGPELWNPLAHGNPTELKDRLIGAERFSEPHYRRAAERYVQTAFTVMQELGITPTLAWTVDLLEPKTLMTAARELPDPRSQQVTAYLRGLSRDQLSAVRGLGSRLAVLSESHAGRYLEPDPAAPGIDLRGALNGGDVVLFSLNSSSYGSLAAQLGTLAVQDLVSAAGARLNQASREPAIVALDEFSALGSEQVVALIARGREAGVSVMLATQELADLDRAGPGFRDQVIGSTALKIAHRQDGPRSAEQVAAMAGSTQAWEQSYSDARDSRQSRVNTRLVDKPVVDPAQIQTLATGEAMVLTKTPSTKVRMARIAPLKSDRGLERE
ncbi:MAG: DUF853 family protein, partial [Solirubrobacterales bacterium]|nr:DUF853 family protein [Solirubrobacterales bacterium]